MKFLKLLLVIFFVGLVGMPVCNAFTDMDETHWAYKMVNLMVGKNILSGFTDGSFKPDDYITREQFATILSKTVEYAGIELPINEENTHPIEDCLDLYETMWAYEYIEKVFNIMGARYYSDIGCYFSPQSLMTREQVAKIMVKIYDLENAKVDYSILKKFSDRDMIDYTYEKYVAIAVANGIMSGNANGTFEPQKNLTRAQIASLMSKLLEDDKNIEENSFSIEENSFSNVEIGSYIKYKGGDYKGNWLVLRNNGENIEIMSAESVGNITLSGADGLVNGVKILNDKAKEYVNPTYAVSGRSLGANNCSMEQIDIVANPLTYETTKNGSLPYHDTYYTDDETIIKDNEKLKKEIEGDAWIASHFSRYFGSNTCSGLKRYRYGDSSAEYLLYLYPDGNNREFSPTHGVIPVITLRSDLCVIEGKGTKSEPYILGLEHESIPVGSYINYRVEGYSGEWVVLRDNGINIEIITKESVGDVTLDGADGYANAVKILNDKARKYVNSKYAVNGKALGATDDSVEQIDIIQYPLKFPVTSSIISPYSDDDAYESIESLMQNNKKLLQKNGDVWLGLRCTGYLSADNKGQGGLSCFGLYCLTGSGKVERTLLYWDYSGGKTSTATVSFGVRPVITLKSGIKIVGGKGTSTDPYQISL